MEPDDLNEFIKNDPRLEALLRQSSAPLPDDGFSTRVLAALPPRTAPRSSYRLAWCLAGAVAGCAVAWFDSAAWANGAFTLPDLDQTFGNVGKVVSDPTFLLAVIIAGGSLILAFGPRALWQRLLQR